MKSILLSAGSRPPLRYQSLLFKCGGQGFEWKEGMSPASFDGLILCGGADPEPSLFGQENCGSFGIEQARDHQDLWLIHQFLKMKKPILGICRGHQMLNIAFGGSLIQHLPTVQYHLGAQGDLFHPLEAEGFVAQTLGNHPTVTSSHHQGLDRLGRGLLPVARTADGVIEAIAHQSLPAYGVQFHPERMESGTALFSWFLEQ